MEPVMKRTLIAAAGLALFAASGLAGAASWSVIVEPGVYGRVAIGGYADEPQVYTPQPVVAIDNGYGQVVEEYVDPAYATDQTPVYLWCPNSSACTGPSTAVNTAPTACRCTSST